MVKIQNKKSVFITLSVTVILLVVLGTLVLPAMSEIKRLNSEILVRRSELERLYRQGQSIRRVASDLESISADLTRVHQSVPKKGA